MKVIFFPGSFNPFTKGHADILKRLLKMSERVVIGIGMNIKKPDTMEQAEKNAGEILDFLKAEGLKERVEIVVYSGLTGQQALLEGADCMARGVRNAADFEYEYSLACINRDAFGIETILLPADPALGFVSSTAIRDLEAHGASAIAKKYRAIGEEEEK